MQKFVLMILISLQGCAITAQDTYPEWFLFPGEYPELITGYSYFTNSSLDDAAMMYCVYIECRVHGYLETLIQNNSRYLKNTEYYYTYEKQCKDQVHEKLGHVSGFCVDVMAEEYISAFSVNPEHEQEYLEIEVDELIMPKWKEMDVRVENGYYYGVGMFTSRGNDNDAWKTAEENAMFNIITFVAQDIFSIVKVEKIGTLSEKLLSYLRINVDFVLSLINS
jgi:hypothetical protein